MPGSQHTARGAGRLVCAFLLSAAIAAAHAPVAVAAPEGIALDSLVVAEPFEHDEPGRSRWLQADSDGDGLDNREEARRTLTNPQRADSDRDGLSDGVEARLTGTNPRRADSDGDGIGDGVELLGGSDPWDSTSIPGPSPSQTAPLVLPSPFSHPPPEPPDPPPPPTPDTVHPETQIGVHPAALTNSATASFTFLASDTGGSGVASFECRRDNGAWAACTSPKGYAGLSEGIHKFEVKAIDGAGNADASPAGFEWTVDLTAPAVTIGAGPDGLTNDATPTFGFSSEPGASLQCSIDQGSADFGPCSSPGTHTPASPLPEAPHTFRVRATDPAGNQNVATRSFEVDTALPPAPQLSSTVPPSPANDNHPLLVGAAPAATTVRLYAGTHCSGAPLDTATPAELEAGIAVSVADDSTTVFRATSTTAAENTSGCSEPLTYVEDSSAPGTQITVQPAALVNSSGATFEFSGSDPDGSGIASFQCKIDGGSFAACTSPKGYSSLANGAHSFEVRAIDAAGNVDATSATHSWTVDTVAPDTQITAQPAALTKATAASFSFTGSDPGGPGIASFQCKLDNGAFTACTSAHEYISLGEGSHTFQVRAIDAAGNTDGVPASYSWTVDTTPPAVQVDSGPTGLTSDSTPTFAFSAAGASFECSIDKGTPVFGSCSAAGSHTPSPALADGAWTFRVRATDAATNQATTTRSFTVDATPPDTQIGAKPASLVNATTASFSFTGSDPSGSGVASFQCKLDSDSFTACTSPKDYTGLTNGAHNFEARAIDEAGNVDATPASYEWQVDTTPPAVQIDSGPSGLTSDPTPTFTFSSEPGASFQCSVDKGTPAFGSCSAAGSHTPAPALADGAWTFRVRATDAATNQAVVTRSFTVDATPPDTQIGAKPASLVNATAASFSFTGSDPGGSGIASFQCKLDSSSFTSCTSPKDYTGLAEGTHTFAVKAIDGATNADASAAGFEWQIDTTPPALSIDSGPDGLTNDATPTFRFSAAGASFECSIDKGTPTFGPCSAADSYTPSPALADSAWTFRVRATDAATNQAVATRSFTVDTTAPPAPQLSSTQPPSPANHNTPKASGTAPPGTTVRLYAGGSCAGTPIATVTPAELETGIPVSVADDSSTIFRATATTAAGNTSGCSEPLVYVEDSSPPGTQIMFQPAALVNSSGATFEFSGSDPGGSGTASFECRLDGGSFAACTSPKGYASLANGSHSFEVRAIDAAGNVDPTPAGHSWTVDTVAPAVTIDSLSKTLLKAGETSQVTWHADENGAFALRVGGTECDTGTTTDSGAYGTTPATKASTVTAAQLVEGVNTLRLCLTDAAGNRTSATTSISKDTVAPDAQIGAKPAALVNSTSATFEFSGSDPGGPGVASFQCRLDSAAPGAWTACTSPKNYTGLVDGSHSFEVRAIDVAGNVGTTPATHGWTVDTVAPDTQITAQPAALTKATAASFSFIGSDPGGFGVASFQCKLDSGSFTACTSAHEYTSLTEGSHTVQVRAIDAAGNIDSVPASYTWTVDTTPPSVSIDSGPTGLTNDSTPTFAFSAPGATFECSVDKGTPAFGSCSAPGSHTPASAIADGAWTFRVRATDAATNQALATRGFTVDATAPNTQIDAKPAVLVNNATANFTFSGSDGAGSGTASFECKLDGGSFTACTSPKNYAGLTDGSHSFEVRAIDAAGNGDATPASHGWTVDATPPDTQITAQPAALTKATAASFSFTGSDSGGPGIASFQCKLDNGAFTACTSAHEYISLGEGSHTFQVRAIDAAGNTDGVPASYSWTVDTTPPAVQIDSGPTGLTSDSTPTFAFSAPGATFQCSIDKGTPAFGSCSAAGSHTPASAIADGAWTFRVRATDAATNQATATRGFTVDATAPDTQITAQPATLTKATNASFSFTGSDPGGSGVVSFQCKLDSGSFTACTSAHEYTGLSDGSHTFEVKAIDQVGNADQTPAAYTWTVDTTAPSVSIDSGPTGLTNDSTPTFAFSAAAATFECSIDKGTPAFGPCSTAGSHTPSPALADGAWTFRVRATDAATNQAVATRNFTVDATAPDTQITAQPAALTKSTAASFSFTGSDPGGSGIASFQCKLDNGAFTACTSAHEYIGLGEDSHTFQVRAIDAAGNTDGAPASYSWTVDTTPPAVQIDSGPTGLTSDATPTFAFSAVGATFECSVDKGTPIFSSCSAVGSHAPSPALADGAWIFRVRATDAATNQATATRSFTVDATPPDTQVGTKPASLVNSTVATFSFTGSDPGGSGVASFQCKLDTGPFTACTSPKDYTGLTNGAHSFEVRVIDAAGNVDATPASHSWTVDATPPDTQITAQPAALTKSTAASFSFTGSDPGGSGVASFQCKLDSGSFTTCTSPKDYTGLTDGTHTFAVKAIDGATNADASPASFEWQIDTTPPALSIDSGPDGLTNDATPTFGFSAPGATLECSIDNGTPTFGSCSGPGSHTPAPLADGAWTFRVRATDAATNQAVATRSFTVDTTAPPAPQLSSTVPPSPANDNDPLLIGTAAPATTVDLYVGTHCSGAPLDTVTPAELEAGIAVSVADDSTTVFRATSTTAAENTSGCSEPLTYVEDSSAPGTQITVQPAALVNSSGATFEFSGSDPDGSGIASFQCKIDGGSFAACTSPKGYSSLANGAHNFEVRAIDAAGNMDATPAGHSWTVDTVAPAVTIDSLSKALLKAGETSQVTWHANENGAFSLRVGGAECDTGALIDSGAYGTSPATKASNVTAAQLVEGANTLRLCLTDVAGNRGSATTSINKDTVAPNTQIDVKPAALASSTSATFEFSGSDPGGSGVASFQCRLDGSSFAACTSPRDYAALSEGPHIFEARAIDQAGNSDQSPAELEWEIDLTPPSISIDRGPDGLTSDPTPTFAFSAPGATFECSLDQGTPAFAPCSAAGSHTPTALLADGAHTFRVRATDAAGNPAVATRGFSVDTTLPPAPELSATVPASPANHNQPLIFGTAQAGTTIRIYAGGTCSGDPVATLSPAALEAGMDAIMPDDSTTVFRATATTGTESTSGCSEALVYIEDSTAPETTLAAPPPSTTASTSATFFLTASEPGTSFECALDGAALTGCPSPWSYANLVPGGHSFTARATDAAGNVDPTPVEWAWTIEPPPSIAPSACLMGGVQATTAAAVRAAVQSGEDVCVTAEIGTVDLRNLGSRPVIVSTEGGSMGDVNINSTTDLTISRARFRSIEMRNSHRTMLLDNTIGGTQASRVPDQLIFMPGENNDVVIEGNDIGWTIADDSGNTGYGCRCYGDLNRLRFVGNKLHDLAADGFQGVGGVDVLIDRNEIGPVGRNPESNEHTDNIQITGNDANLRITNNWIHHQGYYEGGVTANAGSTYIHGGSTGSLTYENNLIETAQGRTEICGLGTGGVERSNLTIRRNTWVDGGQAFNGFPGFEWDCDGGGGNTVTRNIAIDPDGGIADNGYDAALVAPNLFGNPSLVTLDASGNCTSANCNPAGEEPIGYRKPSGVEW